MATIKKHTRKDGKESFQVRIRVKGERPLCASFPKISLAKNYIQQKEAAMREGRYFRQAEAKKHSLGQLIDRYITDVLPKKPKSIRKQSAQLLWWKKRIGHILLINVTPAVIVEQRDKFAREAMPNGILRSPATVARYLAVLSHAFTIAVREWGWVEDSPMRKMSKPREPKGRVRFLDDFERSRLLSACKNSKNSLLHLIVVIALSTGMRRGEILNLSWKDLYLEDKKIILEETKNGERRFVPLAEYVSELLTAYSKCRRLDSFLVFPSKNNPEKSIDIRNAWEKALQEADIKDFRFHDLRHSFASALAMNKATQTELRILLGHKSPSMTARYAHIAETYGAKIVNDTMEKIFPVTNVAGGN